MTGDLVIFAAIVVIAGGGGLALGMLIARRYNRRATREEGDPGDRADS